MDGSDWLLVSWCAGSQPADQAVSVEQARRAAALLQQALALGYDSALHINRDTADALVGLLPWRLSQRRGLGQRPQGGVEYR